MCELEFDHQPSRYLNKVCWGKALWKLQLNTSLASNTWLVGLCTNLQAPPCKRPKWCCLFDASWCSQIHSGWRRYFLQFRAFISNWLQHALIKGIWKVFADAAAQQPAHHCHQYDDWKFEQTFSSDIAHSCWKCGLIYSHLSFLKWFTPEDQAQPTWSD